MPVASLSAVVKKTVVPPSAVLWWSSGIQIYYKDK